MNTALLRFDVNGRIEELSVADWPLPFFNGGTPTGELGSLVGAAFASGYEAAVWVAGLPYTATGALVVDFFGAITHYVAGVPMTVNGVACDAGNPVAYAPGGIPISPVGKVCLGVTDPVNISAFSGAFVGEAFL